MRTRPLLALAGLALLPACMGTGVGQGPIRLSPEVQALYAEYRGLLSPSAFAVSADGAAASYSYCQSLEGCRGNEAHMALEGCRRSGKECFVYDLGGKVVWQGPTLTAPARGGVGRERSV